MIFNIPNVQYIYVSGFEDESQLSCTNGLSIYAPVENNPSCCIWTGTFAKFAYLTLSCNDMSYIYRWEKPQEEQLHYISNDKWLKTVNENTETELKPELKNYFHIVSWLCNDISVGDSQSLNVYVPDEDVSVLLQLDKNKVKLSVDRMTNGSISSRYDLSGTYDYDTQIQISAVPANGYSFYRWKRYDSDYDTAIVDLSSGNEKNPLTYQSLSASFISTPDFEDGTILQFKNVNDLRFQLYTNKANTDIVIDAGLTGE